MKRKDLVFPKDENVTLFLMEDHSEITWETTSQILHAYRPDAIFVEANRHCYSDCIQETLDIYMPYHLEGTLKKALKKEKRIPGFDARFDKSFYPPDNVFGTAAAYALAYDVPLYMCDWDNRCPLALENSLEKYLTGEGITGPSDDELLEALFTAGRLLLDDDAYEQLESSLKPESIFPELCWLFSSSYGVLMRNEFMVLSLNSHLATQPIKRAVSIAGRNHFLLDKSVDGITLQDKVQADNKVIINLTEEKPEVVKVSDTMPLTLPWHRLSYMEPLAELGIIKPNF